MANLPPALQMLLPVLVQDGGRGRAETLQLILGDPDAYRAHLDDIDAALGSSSPGKGRLSRLLRLAEAAVSPSSGRVKRQHYVSQVVLRRFVELVPGPGRVLARHDIGSGVTDLVGTRGVAFLDHFIAVDSATTERLWQDVENNLGPAIDRAARGLTLTKAERLTLRRAVALHFVRNPQSVRAHEKAFEDAAAAQIERLGDTWFAEEAFRRHTGGLVAVGPEGRRIGIERSQGRLRDIYKAGGLFRLSVQRLYEKVSDRFYTAGLAILAPANPSKEFLLGDVPAVTYDATTGAAGLADGVAIDEADEIVMPVTPRLLVVIGPPDAARAISDAEVDLYNSLQVRAARAFVMHRPRTNFAVQVSTWRRN